MTFYEEIIESMEKVDGSFKAALCRRMNPDALPEHVKFFLMERKGEDYEDIDYSSVYFFKLQINKNMQIEEQVYIKFEGYYKSDNETEYHRCNEVRPKAVEVTQYIDV